jgi:glyoxylase-like metal-dependent hydrolase (beta-lactamase superfamily II)
MKILPIIFETWKIDGGVAFGIIPKSIWSKLYPSDEQNLITIVNRSLLIEVNDKKILIDTGLGNKRNQKYYQYKYIQSPISIEQTLANYGFSTDEISDVIFSHLHDDHVGGASYKDAETGLHLEVFKNANYYTSYKQWRWAFYPNMREAGSFFADNLLPLENSGRLHLLKEDEQALASDNIQFEVVNGHTEGQLLTYIFLNDKTFVFVADFIPSIAHISPLYIASVDIYPLEALKEKLEFLERAATNNYILIFEHDYQIEACTISKGEKGYIIDKKGSIKDFL